MFRKPAFWIVFAGLSLLAIVFSVRNFSAAFPILSIDVSMDREAALGEARALAERNSWPPEDFDQAVRFRGDQETQNFIELEGGGKQELARIVRDGLYITHKWHVRHFKPGDAHETRIQFAPDGRPYSFAIALPEQEPGATLDAPAARSIAESGARNEWQVDFGPYDLAESSKETRPGGRTDHTFVYERRDVRAGEGRYRLRLVVGGDKLTELTHYIQIPEAFSRRYEELRSANDSIGAAANLAMLVLYLLLCCGVGLFFMMRQRWVEWRQPVIWAFLIALLTFLELFNFWPLIWMDYDTALPAGGYAARQIATAMAGFLALGIIMAISFMAAETLTRRAFPRQIQLWRIWSPDTAASKDVLGYTVAGYLLISIFFAYEIVLYAFAHTRLGWWSPSDALIDPNIFAAYSPAFTAVAHSLQAGFWEECLFRAVPLATAALIGDRFGKRWLFIVAAMIIQALIFGAGHAGYANQPSYARVVELIIPSFAFGALYLAFGLLPGIILHYGFDLVWFSLPVFASSAPRARFEQVLVLLLGLAPVLVVFAARYKSGRWVETPGETLNEAWRPNPVKHAPPPAPLDDGALSGSAPLRIWRWLPLAGLAGLLAWTGTSSLTNDAPPITVDRPEAENLARQALAGQEARLDESWKVLQGIAAQPGQDHRFVWKTAGRDNYNHLLGTYLPVPRRTVRFARFEGDVAERAEEYVAHVSGDGTVSRVRHQLPEAAAGAALTEEEAREPARKHVVEKLGIPAADLIEISAEAQKRPARVDWDFEFRDARDYGLPEGEARVAVSLAGSRVVDARRYIHVPDEWARSERAQRNIPNLLAIVCSVAMVGIGLTGAVVAAVRWSRKQAFSTRRFLSFAGILFLLDAIAVVNNIPGTTAQFSTAQPYFLQLAIAMSLQVVLVFCGAAAFGLIAGIILPVRSQTAIHPGTLILVGVALGAAIAGIAAAANAVGPAVPQWIGFTPAATAVPFVTSALAPLSAFLRQVLILWLIFLAAGRIRRLHPALLLIPAGIIETGASSIESISSWLIAGTAAGIVLTAAYLLAFRHQPNLIPLAYGTVAILATLETGLRQAHPASLPGAVAGSLLIAAAAWLWSRAATRSAVREGIMQSASD